LGVLLGAFVSVTSTFLHSSATTPCPAHYIRTHTHTHTHTHAHTHTHTRTHTYTHTSIFKCAPFFGLLGWAMIGCSAGCFCLGNLDLFALLCYYSLPRTLYSHTHTRTHTHAHSRVHTRAQTRSHELASFLRWQSGLNTQAVETQPSATL